MQAIHDAIRKSWACKQAASFSLRRVNAKVTQGRPQIDQAGTIQAQTGNRRATCCREAEYLCRVRIPSEMLGPSLLSWMKYRHVLVSRGVAPGNKYSLETVTSKTRKSKI